MCSEATRDRYVRIYRSASLSVRRRFAITLAMILVCGTSLFAFSDADGAGNEVRWFTPQNILTVGVLVYHLGMLRSQFNDVQKRLERFENNAADLYAPRDETFRRLDQLERRRSTRE